MSSQNSNKGFTLVETMIYIAIIGGVVVSFVSFSISITNSRNKNFVMQEVQANTRTAFGILTKSIRQADEVYGPTVGFTSSTLYLDMPFGQPDLYFYVEGGVLKMLEGGTTSTAITSDKVQVEDLKFQNLGKPGRRDNINIDMSVHYAGEGQDIAFEYVQTLRTSASIRNQ